MLFWSRVRLATSLTPDRMKLLDSKYAQVPLRVRMEVYDMFRNHADSIEWVLGQYKRYPDLFGPETQNINALKQKLGEWLQRANWWDSAKTTRDPRVTQHPEFNPTRKFDLGAYSPGQLDAMRRRAPTPVRPRELHLTHEPPIRLVSREERPDGVWEIVEIDGTGVSQKEYEDQIVDFWIQAAKVLDKAGIKGVNVLDKNSICVIVRPHFAQSPNPTPSPREVIQQDIVQPARKAGWVVQTYASPEPYYKLFPPVLKKYIKALCQYGEGTKWCTTQPDNAAGYLLEGPLYITLHDGYPVAQAWGPKDDPYSNSVMNREDDPEHNPEILQRFRDNTNIRVVNWRALDLFVINLQRHIPKLDFRDYVPQNLDIDWLVNNIAIDPDDLELTWKRANNAMTKLGNMGDSEGKELLRSFIQQSESVDAPPLELEPYVEILLGSGKKPDDFDEDKFQEAVDWYHDQFSSAMYIAEKLVDILSNLVDKEKHLVDSLDEIYDQVQNQDMRSIIQAAQTAERYDETGYLEGLAGKIEAVAIS